MLKKLLLETFVKNLRSKMLLKKKLRNSVAKNNRTKMMLRKLLLETFVKNLRSKMLPENLPRNSVAKNNRTKILSRKLPLEMFVKMICNRKLPKTYQDEVPLIHSYRNAARKKTIARNVRQKVPRKIVANNNRTEMLLKSLPLETFVKKCLAKSCRKNTRKECC